MSVWRPLHEALPNQFPRLRRVLMAGYFREGDQDCPRVGEAEWCDPSGRGATWYWANGWPVINPLSFQDLPDFPIEAENSSVVVGRQVPGEVLE